MTDNLDDEERAPDRTAVDLSNLDGSSCTGSNAEGAEAPEEIRNKLAKKETRNVTLLRLGLLGVLSAAAISVSLSVYFYTRNREVEDFERSFKDNAIKLTESFQAIAEHRLGAIASFGTTVTAYALATNATWPFVTIPSFEAQGKHALSLADASSIGFSPIITDKDREKWENEYVPENIGWLEESYTFSDDSKLQDDEAEGGASIPQASDPPPPYDEMPDTSQGYSKQIQSYGMTSLGTIGRIIAPQAVRYMPWWQKAPSSRGERLIYLNFDLVIDPSFQGMNLLSVLDRKKAALGGIALEGYTQQRAEIIAPAITGFYYPVLESHAADAPVVGSLSTLVFWNTMLEGILPNNVQGVVVVLRNSCDQAVTFLLNGADVESVDEGDHHDPSYDYLKQEVLFTALVNEGIESKTYKGFPVDDEGCQYTLSVYPSSQMEDYYITKMPIVYLLGALLIFVLTSLIFILYDRFVERRQKLVMREAEKSGAIVSSLFPDAYRDRLMDEQENKLGDSVEVKASRLTRFMTGEDDVNAADDGEPIADHFPDCTVFFADIVGFTKWSSSRTPGDVFRLLQSVYAAFDKIAEQRKVFKVETIGDSYMSVTGLPQPQGNHAVIMAKFANDCITQMHETTRKLVGQLGVGTEDLCLRLGMHSGPVTAGILRGAKSRFQLFGDTVNTASRMESTGEKSRIQASAATAELLQDAGKGHWLQAREELIQAKGKGAMQTYWVLPSSRIRSNDESKESLNFDSLQTITI